MAQRTTGYDEDVKIHRLAEIYLSSQKDTCKLSSKQFAKRYFEVCDELTKTFNELSDKKMSAAPRIIKTINSIR